MVFLNYRYLAGHIAGSLKNHGSRSFGTKKKVTKRHLKIITLRAKLINHCIMSAQIDKLRSVGSKFTSVMCPNMKVNICRIET